jgi:hypothetical protein
MLRLLLVAVALLAALLGAPSAQAEEVFTGQAAAANATDSTWIPAPAQPAAVCVIDTGNDPLPDTSNVTARFATDGGDGADLNPGKHGTLMSMIASAPYDGFGMVGVAPSVKVVSVRASRDGLYFGGTDLSTAMQLCVSKRNIYNIKVVSLSLGTDPSVGGINANAYQRADFQDQIDNARRAGLNVVAAAGNSNQGSVDWPAGYAPSFAVAAADNGGVRCSFASWGVGVDLWAPGCPLDVGRPDASGAAAWANGSSEATAFVAGALAQLRGLAPSLSVDQAEQLLTANATAKAVGPYVNIGGAFAAAGLSAQLAAGHALIPAPVSATPSTSSDSPPPAAAPAPAPSTPPVAGVIVDPPANSAARARLSKPRVLSLSLRRGVLTIVFRGKPRKVEARVEVYARKKGRAFPSLTRSLRVRGDRLRTRVSGALSQVSITYRDPTGKKGASATLSLRPPPRK